MTNQAERIIFTDKSRDERDSEYIDELEKQLWETRLQARKAEQREYELRQKLTRQARRRAELEYKARHMLNATATGVMLCGAYVFTYIAANTALALIPLTLGILAAYRWGRRK